MSDVGVTQLRDSIPGVVERVRYRGERVIVKRHGKPVMAIVSIEDLQVLQELEDRADIGAAERAESEPGPSIPWERIRAESDALR